MIPSITGADLVLIVTESTLSGRHDLGRMADLAAHFGIRTLLRRHFGHCEEFAMVDVNSQEKSMSGISRETAPVHAPSILAQWLGQQKVNVVIAGGIGSRAQSLFTQYGIQVVTGATAGSPETVVNAYLNGTLQTGTNVCDH